MAVVLPEGHTYPGTQAPEHAADVKPEVPPYVPGGQGAVQLADPRPGPTPYRPALQLVHTAAPSRLYLPAGHTAAVALVDPGAQLYPGLHCPLQTGVAWPVLAPYRPPAQALHSPAPLRLYVPAVHRAAVALIAPVGQAYPALQLPMQLDDTSPEVLPYRPESQGPLQAADVSPGSEPNRPALHGVQTPAPPRLKVPGRHATAVGDVDPTGQLWPALQLPLQAALGRPAVAP